MGLFDVGGKFKPRNVAGVKSSRFIEPHDIEFSGSSPEHMKLILGNMLSERAAVSAYMVKKRNAQTRNVAD